MNVESNSKTQGTQSGKNTYKRAHRANRPVLVTQQEQLMLDEPTAQAIEEALQPEVPVEAETPTVSKRRPGFFSNIGKSASSEANPQTVRMARAMRGKVVDGPKTKETTSAKESSSSSRAGSVPPRPRSRSGFKTRYIWGMMAYLLIADFLGIWITNFMIAHGMDGIVFKWGSFTASRSTLVFLALLIIILVLMARFDLIPSSFKAAMSGSNSTPSKGSVTSKRTTAATFETKKEQPTMKQGVSGQHDDLYQEYRDNQRYFQKRDRKR
jgi:hypothetical protein